MEWIDIKTCLPEIIESKWKSSVMMSELILVYNVRNCDMSVARLCVGRLYDHKWWSLSQGLRHVTLGFDYFTHWMSIPKFPEDKRKKYFDNTINYE